MGDLPQMQRVAAYNVCVDNAGRILMCRLSDITERPGWWTLPGGGIDFGEHPEAGALRELTEETGYAARAVKLVGCWDRDARGHTPKLPFSIYKLFFLCEATGEVGPPQALETLEVGWFGLDELPALSSGRINAFELGRIVAHHRDRSLPTEFD